MVRAGPRRPRPRGARVCRRSRMAQASCSVSPRIAPARIGRAALVVPAGIVGRATRLDARARRGLRLASWRSGGRVSSRPPSSGSPGRTRTRSCVESTELAFRGTRARHARCRATRRSKSWPASRRRSWSSPASTIPSSHRRAVLPRARELFPNLVGAEDARRLPPHPRRVVRGGHGGTDPAASRDDGGVRA